MEKILSKCKNCHQISNESLEKMGSLCGQDCWDCHSVKKVMSIPNVEHSALYGYIECHKKLDENTYLQQPSLSVDINNFFNGK